MQAVQIIEQGKPLEAREVPLPEPGGGEIRVKVEAAGICHSDAHYRAGTGSVGKLPITPGHEIAGTIDRLGSSVTDLAVGERVALHYLITCGHCDYCAQGLEQFCRSGSMLARQTR